MLDEICKELNSHLPVMSDEDITFLNEIINEAYDTIPGFNIYWDRQIYIDCGFDDEKMHDIVTQTDKVHFEPSDDVEEHNGVVVRYN